MAQVPITPGIDERAVLVDSTGTALGTVGNPVNVTGGGGGGGAVTVADGADVAEGATTDAANTTGTTGTVSGKLRGLVTILADVWNSSMHFLKVGGVSAVGSPPGGNPISIAGFDGTNKQHLLTDTAGRLEMVGAAAAGTAVAGNPVLAGGSDGTSARALVTDGSGHLTVVGAAGNGIASVGNPVFIAATDGVNIRQLQAFIPSNDTVLSPNNHNALAVSAEAYNFNGSSNFERVRNNIDVTLLSSASRTTTQTSADITTYNAHSIIVTLDMTAVGTGSVTLAINYKDPASGKYVPLLTGAAVTTNSTNVYTINPNIPAVANVSAQKDLGRVIQIVVTANNANAATYSVGYTLMS